MWVLLLAVCLLDQNQAAPLPGEQSSVQPILLQQQVYQTSPSPSPAAGRQRTSSSSSSSSSSSASSESSHSSEDVQQLREKQRLENTAVEQVDYSQESTELLRSLSSSLVSELVLLGQRAGEQEGERSTGDDSAGSAESRQRALMLTFHPLLTRPQHAGAGGEAGLTASDLSRAAGEGGGAVVDEGEVGVADVEVGGARGAEVDDVFPRLSDHSTERGLTFDSPGRTHRNGYHGNDAELELGL